MSVIERREITIANRRGASPRDGGAPAWQRRRGCDVGAREIKEMLAERTDALVRALLPAGRRSGGWWKVGSLDGEKGDSLGVELSGARRGYWRDYATGEHGDALDLVRQTKGYAMRDALDWARGWLGIERAGAAPAKSAEIAAARERARAEADAREQAKREETRGKARALWLAAERLSAGSPALLYLTGRGLPIGGGGDAEGGVPPALRFLADCWCDEVRYGLPALVAAVQDPAGRFAGVHRIYLERAGDAAPREAWRKASLQEPKKTYGPIHEGTVRLGSGRGRARGLPGWLGLPGLRAVAEGIETMLALADVLPPTVALHAAINATNLRYVRWPDETLGVAIFGDHDPVCQKRGALEGKRPGRVAAEDALRRYAEQGVVARIVMPPAAAPRDDERGVDWLDERGRAPARRFADAVGMAAEVDA